MVGSVMLRFPSIPKHWSHVHDTFTLNKAQTSTNEEQR
jgi:hypothetical protein